MYAFASALLAANEQRNLDPDIVRPGWTALGIFVLMVIAVALLGWSLSKFLGKARQTWDGDEPGASAEAVSAGAESVKSESAGAESTESADSSA